MPSKRYTIVNQYIKSSCIPPQVCHGLNNLWKSLPIMTEVAKSAFLEWANHSEFEIHLQGGDDVSLESLYVTLQNISDVPSAKFNEAGMRNSCTVVTFVASERIVAANNYIRFNRVPMKDVHSVLSGLGFAALMLENDSVAFSFLTEAEITVAEYISKLGLAS